MTCFCNVCDNVAAMTDAACLHLCPEVRVYISFKCQIMIYSPHSRDSKVTLFLILKVRVPLQPH